MYEEFFGLQRRPFSATPDATCFVPLEGAQGVLDALAVSCERGQGISVLTGETGVGKTLVGLRLAFELQPTFATAFLNHSAFPTRRALLQAILFELNRPYNRMAEQELRLELMAALKTLIPQQQALVVILDEAHRLSLPVLDEVRMLTMLADNGVPLARVVLIGNRDLEERLADPDLSAFNQRICCQVDLEPLTQAESIEYLRSCIEIAGAHPDDLFAADVLPFIAKAADGNPRCLNHLADHSLLLAFVSEQRPVTADVVRDALNDLKQLPLTWNDPVGGGEIYRGMSHPPVMEDSAVNLWPQTERHDEDEEAVESADDSWAMESLGQETSAIEIGGESATFESSPAACGTADVADEITCLKNDWRATTPRSMSLDDVLADVAVLTEQVPFEPELSAADTLSGSPYFGQVFDLQETHQPVWNLPTSPWESADDAEFEEEPVVDRYVRIESGLKNEGIVWNVNAPHGRLSGKRASVVSAPQMGAAFDDDHESQEQELTSAGDFSGIVESYARPTRERDQGHIAFTESRNDSPNEKPLLPQPRPERHLPTQLLQATFEDDGIEEQLGAAVLDLYLETQQMVNRVGRTGVPTISLDEPEEETPRAFDVVQPDPSRKESPHDERGSTGPDVIQRAYGRLFSELRRKKR